MNFSKFYTIFYAFLLFSSSSHASSGFKELIQQYQYAITVEWDQQDKEFLKEEETKLMKGIKELLQNGQSPDQYINDVLTLIPDLQRRQDIESALKLYGDSKLSKEQLMFFLNQHASSIGQQGSSWSTTGKILLGIVITYAVLKVIMFTIYFWDTDPDYGKTSGDLPPEEPLIYVPM